VVVYENTVTQTESTFDSAYFTCTGGNTLQIWFDNTGASPCTVTLYKKTAAGNGDTEVSFNVDAGSSGSDVYRDPGGTTFMVRVVAEDGSGVSGTLRASQLGQEDG
jgi:hypothetical protein